MTKKHKDTKISLQPLSFEEAIKSLAQSPKHGDSEAEESDNTKVSLESDSSKKRTAPHRESSSD